MGDNFTFHPALLLRAPAAHRYRSRYSSILYFTCYRARRSLAVAARLQSTTTCIA
jgi:hypothetical protein